MPPNTPQEVNTPREPRFVALAGDLYEVDDIIDALNGRNFLASLNRFDLEELGGEGADPASVTLLRQRKTAALKAVVAKSTDGVRDNLPNRAAILMALDENGDLQFNNVTEFLARFAPLTRTDAVLVATVAREVRDTGTRILDGTQALGGPFSLPVRYSLDHAEDIKVVLGETEFNGVWGNVNTAIIERALTGQDFVEADWLQLFNGDEVRNEARRDTMSLRERAEEYSMRGFSGGATLTLAGIFAVTVTGETTAIVATAGFLGLTLLSGVANKVIQATPDTWLVWLSTQAPTISNTIGFSSPSARRASDVIPTYKALFKRTKARIEDLKKTPVGRVGIVFIQEILGQEGGTFTKDEEALNMLRVWTTVFRKDPTLAAKFNEMFEGYPAEAFESYHEVRDRFLEFNRTQRNPPETSIEGREQKQRGPQAQTIS